MAGSAAQQAKGHTGHCPLHTGTPACPSDHSDGAADGHHKGAAPAPSPGRESQTSPGKFLHGVQPRALFHQGAIQSLMKRFNVTQPRVGGAQSSLNPGAEGMNGPGPAWRGQSRGRDKPPPCSSAARATFIPPLLSSAIPRPPEEQWGKEMTPNHRGGAQGHPEEEPTRRCLTCDPDDSPLGRVQHRILTFPLPLLMEG